VGTHALVLPSAVALHTPDWQLEAAPKHGPVPSVRPHLPFDASHTFVTHWLAAVQVVVVFGPAQVFVTALHWPEVQVAAAFAVVHVPSWSPSFGIATPFALSSTQVSVFRLQCFAAAQSAST
jgi:hypothetical protein